MFPRPSANASTRQAAGVEGTLAGVNHTLLYVEPFMPEDIDSWWLPIKFWEKL